VAGSEPELAGAVREIFDAHRHKTLATLRADGAPRISGQEVGFVDGELWLGMMPGSRKAVDLQRDPRFALHSASVDPPAGDPAAWRGDAKLSGLAVQITDAEQVAAVLSRLAEQGDDAGQPAGAGQGGSATPAETGPAETEQPAEAAQPAEAGQAHLFRADIREVVLTRVGAGGDHLVIVLWRAGHGLRRFERR
jgi:hypothetical protein